MKYYVPGWRNWARYYQKITKVIANNIYLLSNTHYHNYESINIVKEHLNNTHAIDLVITSKVDLSNFGGPVLPGYESGDVIELRYVSDGQEEQVTFESDGSTNDQISLGKQGDGYMVAGSIARLNSVHSTDFGISSNYPNPFNPSTVIEYNVEFSGHVSLKVYDVMGRLVRTLVNDHKESGQQIHQVVWDGKDNDGQQVSAGLYLYTLRSNGKTDHAKMVLMK